MSKGNRQKNDHTGQRMGGISLGKPGVYRGKRWVKRAGMWVEYECHNDTKRPDIFNWTKE